MNVDWLAGAIKHPSRENEKLARQRQEILTKPPGSLGRLEQLASRLAALQGSLQPRLEQVHITIFAADHGVAVEGVSAFPQAVTGQMVANFITGGAAISVLARELDAVLEVVDVGTIAGSGDLPGVINTPVAAGSGNIRRQDAMDEAQLAQALQAGASAVERAQASSAQLFIGGDMGIANTTAAAAIACALLELDPRQLAGPGTGLDAAGVVHKAEVIADALARRPVAPDQPLVVLRQLGGFEIAALCGAYLRAAQLGLPVLVDGYITTAAALVAVRYQPAVREWLLFAHRSAEPGHHAMLQALEADPLLDLGMRLGEGSGAAAALPLLRLACALHNGMATFADAGVSEG